MFEVIENIKDDLNDLGCDIRAEVVTAELAANGINLNDVAFKNKSGFKRQFEKDIQDIKCDDDTGSGKKIFIELNREGLYDYLPEGLFHFETNKRGFKSSSEALDEIRMKRLQEQEARAFFHPMENEYRHLQTELEIKESGTVNQFSAEQNRKLFFQTFGYLPEFNDVQIAKLLFFLPLASKFRGNMQMLSFILENLLNIPVSVNLKNETSFEFYEAEKDISKLALGIDLVMGNKVLMHENCLHIHLYEIEKKHTTLFFENGLNYQIIEKVIAFLMPIQYNFKIVYHFCEADKYAFTAEKENFSFLGFNSVI